MHDVMIRRLTPGEASSAVNLVRASFDPSVLAYMIYGQRGMAHYLADSCSAPALDTQREPWVAAGADGQLLAFADFDLRHEAAPHLAYICVADAARERGLAARLIQSFVDAHPLATSLSLNVFEDNAVAHRLYTALGFVETGRSEWRLRPVPAGHGTLRVRDYPQSLASHARYGFSRLLVLEGDEPTMVGRMGDHCVSVPSPALFADDELLALIGSAFPAVRRVLHIANDGEVGLPLDDQSVLLRSIAMTASLPLRLMNAPMHYPGA